MKKKTIVLGGGHLEFCPIELANSQVSDLDKEIRQYHSSPKRTTLASRRISDTIQNQSSSFRNH